MSDIEIVCPNCHAVVDLPATDAHGFTLDASTDEAPAEWCPVCKHYHADVGEQTDAGLITRACPNVPTYDPRYYGSPVYTGDRGEARH